MKVKQQNTRGIYFSFCAFLTDFIMFTSVGVTDEMASSLGTTSSKIGLIFTFYSLFFAISSPFFDWVLKIKREFFNDFRIVILGLLLFSFGNLFCGISNELLFSILAASFTASGASLVSVRLSKQASFTNKKIKSALGYIYLGFGFASALGLSIVSEISSHFGWRIIYIVVSIIGIILMIVFLNHQSWFLAEEIYFNETNKFLGKSKKMAFTLIICITFLVVSANSVFEIYVNPLAISLHLKSKEIIFIFLALGLGSVLGSYFGSKMSLTTNSLRYLRLFLLFFSLSGVCIYLLRFNIILMLLSLFFWSFFQWSTGPICLLLIIRLSTTFRSIGIGINNISQNLGACVGSFIGLLSFSGFGVSSLSLSSSLIVLVGFFLTFSIKLEKL
ncbi:MAG: MFS transporter [Oenococcus oeni]|uniref:MFS transporter n=1 Tax=Oenococcus oeni TaxID=1247 RepID=UPI0010BA3E1B|nr:MFS transporter [Oenococcus oeni]SYV99002.1 membrane hypothetical protein [Oenococcus oeni]